MTMLVLLDCFFSLIISILRKWIRLVNNEGNVSVEFNIFVYLLQLPQSLFLSAAFCFADFRKCMSNDGDYFYFDYLTLKVCVCWGLVRWSISNEIQVLKLTSHKLWIKLSPQMNFQSDCSPRSDLRS